MPFPRSTFLACCRSSRKPLASRRRWNRRARVRDWIETAPSRAIAAFGVAGFGLGLLIASAMSFFFWWWAVGAALFVAMHVPVLIAAAGRERQPDR